MEMSLITLVAKGTVTVAQNSTKFTATIPFKFCSGFSAVKLKVSAGSVTTSWQVSGDEQLWFDAVDGSGNALYGIASVQSSGSKWVFSQSPFAPYVRLKFVEVNVASVTVNYEVYIQEGV